jgi:hypothetical protein
MIDIHDTNASPRMQITTSDYIISHQIYHLKKQACEELTVRCPETVTARTPVCAWRRCFTRVAIDFRIISLTPHGPPPPESYSLKGKLTPACPSNQGLCRTTPTCPTSSAEAVRRLHEGHPHGWNVDPLGPVIYTPCQGRG